MILFVPFLIPIIMLALIGTKFTVSGRVQSIAVRLQRKTWIFWLCQAALGLLFGRTFEGQDGVIVTLVLPNLFFMICYVPYFLGAETNSKRIFIEGALCVISTLVFWLGSVGSHNWQASGLAFMFIYPALFMMTAVATGLVFFRSNLKLASADSGPKRRVYIFIVVGGLVTLSFVVAKNIFYEKYAMREPLLKLQLLCRIAKIATGDSSLLTTHSAIAKGAFAGLYEVKDKLPRNKYDGEISVRQENDIIFVAYSEIPTVAPCANMIVMYSSYGFMKVYINGEPFIPVFNNSTIRTVNEYSDQVEDVCRRGGSKVKIEFGANKSDLVEPASSCVESY